MSWRRMNGSESRVTALFWRVGFIQVAEVTDGIERHVRVRDSDREG